LSTEPVLPVTPTFPVSRTWNASMALCSLLRSSWARWPSRSASRADESRARMRANSVTEAAIAVSRQRFRMWNSPVEIGSSSSSARLVMDWQTSP